MNNLNNEQYKVETNAKKEFQRSNIVDHLLRWDRDHNVNLIKGLI